MHQVRFELYVGEEWLDITGDVYTRDPATITFGRPNEGTRPTPGSCSLTITNRDGRYSPLNPNSPYFGLLGRNTPLRVSVTTPAGILWRFHGEVANWPVEWRGAGHDVWAPIEAAGILRRLGQSTPPLRDPLRRHIERHGPLAYWPLTDGEDARYGSPVAGGRPMQAIGVSGSLYQGQPTWGRGMLAPWLDPVVELPDETIGRMTAAVLPQSVTSWSVDHVFAGGGEGYRNGFEIWDDGPRTTTVPRVQWTIHTDPVADTLELQVTEWFDGSANNTFETIEGPGVFDELPHHVRLTVTDDLVGGLDWYLFIDGQQVATASRTTDFRAVATLTYRWGTVDGGGGSIETEAVQLGHIVYWGENPPHISDTWAALHGHRRERAGRRIERLCAEQGVALQVTGGLDDTQPMGPQRAGAFLDLLASASDVDGGVLYESRDVLGLAYRTQRSMYNQEVSEA